jgi:predicted nucleic acid-binding protein
VVADLQGLGISGGAVFDALIAMTALDAGATLHTLDVRALPTYERSGARHELLR